ncbi:hypothetical protein GJ496_001878, partial [Pomphorhynchus laevis]
MTEDSEFEAVGAMLASINNDLRRSIVNIKVNDHNTRALIDTGSSTNFINASVAKRLRLTTHSCHNVITMAATDKSSTVKKYCIANAMIQGRT